MCHVLLVLQAGTGTWDGPAPRGAATAQALPAVAAAAAVHEPQHVTLCNGAAMPMIGLGTYKIESADVIRTALDVGFRNFDCAAMYGNEKLVGEGLSDYIKSGRRNELFITSKFWQTEHRPEAVRASCLKSISDLGCEYLDLFLVHWPEAWLPGSDINDLDSIKEDTEVTLQDTWRALESLVDERLVRAIGFSNASLAQIEDMLATAKHKPAVNQIELHPLLAQRKMVGVCARKGVVCVAHSSLGRKSSGELLNDAAVQQIAQETGKTVTQVLLKYNLQRGVPVIPKASFRKHLEENLVGMFDWKLSNQQKAALDALDCNKRFIDYPWKVWGNPEEGGAAKPSKVLAGGPQAAVAAGDA
eukprot:jgi/Chrzof1/10382/Cz04g39250.t1